MTDTAAQLSLVEARVLRFRTPITDPVQYEMRCIAPHDCDLSFKQLYEPDEKKRKAFQTIVGHTFATLNLRTVYAPKPSFNAMIGPPAMFTEEILLPYNVTVKRPVLKIEGTEIMKHEGAAFTMGGCSFLVLTFMDRTGTGRCLIAHAGTASLVDFEHVLHSKEPREHYSIIDALVEYAVVEGGAPERMALRSFFEIPWEAYSYSAHDSAYGEDNAALRDHLIEKHGRTDIMEKYQGHEHLRTKALVEAQALAHGIVNVSSECILPLGGPFAYTRHSNLKLRGEARNLAIIVL